MGSSRVVAPSEVAFDRLLDESILGLNKEPQHLPGLRLLSAQLLPELHFLHAFNKRLQLARA